MVLTGGGCFLCEEPSSHEMLYSAWMLWPCEILDLASDLCASAPGLTQRVCALFLPCGVTGCAAKRMGGRERGVYSV